MNENQSQTESMLEIIKGIEAKSIMLPEFQRDFRWELNQTYDLFDSLIRNIFIGTIIYGKPAFEMTLREMDNRPRKGKGSNAKLIIHNYTNEQIQNYTQTKNLKIVLDGQQRITSLYRAIVGIDTVYIILKKDKQKLEKNEFAQLSLEDIISEVGGDESNEAISVKLSDGYDAETKLLDDEDLNERFSKTSFAKTYFKVCSEEEKKMQKKFTVILLLN